MHRSYVAVNRFYCKEETLVNKVVQVTEKNLLLKTDTSWSTYKLPVVLSECVRSCEITCHHGDVTGAASPFCNFAKACSSRKSKHIIIVSVCSYIQVYS